MPLHGRSSDQDEPKLGHIKDVGKGALSFSGALACRQTARPARPNNDRKLAGHIDKSPIAQAQLSFASQSPIADSGKETRPDP